MEQNVFLFIAVLEKVKFLILPTAANEDDVSVEITEMSCCLLPHPTGKNMSLSSVFQDNFPIHLL